MAVEYFDVCDKAFKRDSETWELKILRRVSDSVIEDKPTKYESAMFDRNWSDSGVITERVAYALALNPGLSYDCIDGKDYIYPDNQFQIKNE